MENLYNKASLVLTPQMVEAGKVYSMKPEDRKGDFTFSRSTAATRVNADGNIEKETQNLLLQSNSFDTTWTNANSTETGGQSGYDGTNDAWLVEGTGSGVFSYLYQNDVTSFVKTKSVYAKAGSVDWLGIWSGSSNYAYFDLNNGVTGLKSGSRVIESAITSVGNGWYRCEVAMTQDATSFYIVPAASDGGASLSTGENIYIQDAQLEQGMVARDYIETTTAAVYGGITDNTPRLDYTDSSCPALLLEPQRTNIMLQSEAIDIWGSKNGVTTEPNTTETLSPEGVYNATKLTAATTDPYIYQSLNVTADPHTMSLYVKGVGDSIGKVGRILFWYIGTATGTGASHDFTLTGDWQRIEATTTPTGTGSMTFRVDIPANTSVIGDEAYIYGVQVEAGSYATSYIPTYGSAVTRNGDFCEVENQSALINSEQGTMYFEGIAIDPSFANVLSFSDGTNNNRISLTLPQNATNINAFSSVGGSKIDNNILHDPSINSKYAIVWNGNSFKAFVNGVKKVDNTMAGSFSANTLTDIRFDRGDGGLNFGGFCKSYLSIASALTDQEAIDLTTI